MRHTALRDKLEEFYNTYTCKRYVDPDPLLFLYNYPDKKDREVAGFIAASLAYGRVEMIMKTVGQVLDRLGKHPAAFLRRTTKKDLAGMFQGFVYRFAREDHLVGLLWGLRRVMTAFSSLEACFESGLAEEDETIVSGLTFLSDQIRGRAGLGHLLADPKKRSACKRSHLFLRWMVRSDKVDPGGWDRISPARLVVPLDRHMHTAGTILGFTRRRNADLKTALEITQGFRALNPRDPVKYDFCLTRLGIRREMSMETLREIREECQ